MSESADRPILFWIQARRGYDSVFILEARPGSLRLIHPTLRAWSIRIVALLLLLFLPLLLLRLILYLAWGPIGQWTGAKSSLQLPILIIVLAVFFFVSGRPSLAFLADRPEKVEDYARVLKIRRTGRWATDKILMDAWGSEIWVSVVTNEQKLRAALMAAGQEEPEIETPSAPSM